MSDVVIKNFTVKYPEKTIFDSFNITFAENKISVIMGESGVGKTTLLNAIAGLIKYDGDIEGVDGKVSYIFQKDRLIPTISVYKNLDLVLRAVFKDKAERKARIEKFAKIVEIDGLLNKHCDSLSGGEAQRVAMARAFAYPSKVLLLDEPFKALDDALKSRLIAQLLTLNEIEPRTVIFVTHSKEERDLCADDYYLFSSNPVRVESSKQ